MIKPSYIISKEAVDDLNEIAIWYETKKEFLGSEFFREFYDVAVEKICTKPTAFLHSQEILI